MSDDATPPLYDDLMRFKPAHLSANGWAVLAGVSRSVWADVRRHGNPSRRTLEKLLAVAGSTLAEFEALRIGGPQGRFEPRQGAALQDAHAPLWRGAPMPMLAVWKTAEGGEWGEPESQIEQMVIDPRDIVDQIARPASVAGDGKAYAVTIIGDTMRPRFRPGRRVIVSPLAPVAIGDDVIVRLLAQHGSQDGGAIPVLIKELARRTESFIELLQFTPDRLFRIELRAVVSIEKVLGEAI